MMRTALPSPDTIAHRVLVIEDNPDGREMLRLLLELKGHRVEVAGDGLRGLQKALAWSPQVAVVDIGLPGLDGYQVARQVRRPWEKPSSSSP